MSGSYNKVILIGNLGRDPEIRRTNEGSRVGSLSIATGESWKDKTTGERKERTEWHRVVIFNENLVDIAEKYLKKGSKILVEGQLQTRKWTDPNGVERYMTEVVLSRFKGDLTMLDTRGDSPSHIPAALSETSYGSFSSEPFYNGGSGENTHTTPPTQSPIDDDVPF